MAEAEKVLGKFPEKEYMSGVSVWKYVDQLTPDPASSTHSAFPNQCSSMYR